MYLSYQERKATLYHLSNFHANLSFSFGWALPTKLVSFRGGGRGAGKIVHVDLETNVSLERG